MPPRQAATPSTEGEAREGLEVMLAADLSLFPFPDADGIEIHSGGALVVMMGRQQLAVFAPGAYVMAARPSVIRSHFDIGTAEEAGA